MPRLTKMDKTVIEAALFFLEAGELDTASLGFTNDELDHAIRSVQHWKTYSHEDLDKIIGCGIGGE